MRSTHHHSPLITHHSSLTTHHSPLTTHHSPLITSPSGCAAGGQGQCPLHPDRGDRLAVLCGCVDITEDVGSEILGHLACCLRDRLAGKRLPAERLLDRRGSRRPRHETAKRDGGSFELPADHREGC